MSLFVSTGCGCTQSTHILCASHCTMQPLCSTLSRATTQWRSTLSNDTTPALCRDGKNGHNTRHTLPVGTARRHRFAEITREEDRVAPRKIAPRKPGAKKESEGALIWRFEWGGIFQQKYDRWGLCEACVAEAKVPGPKWLMVNTDWHTKCTLFSLSLLM